MKLYQVEYFNKLGVGDTDDNPVAADHYKFVRYNHNKLAFELYDINASDIYLSNVTREIDSNSALFVLNDEGGTTYTLPLGALAWLDEVPEQDLGLPGNTKILFDDNDAIGGDDSFLFDKLTKDIKLSNNKRISARDTTRHSTYNNLIQYIGNRNILLNTGNNTKTLLETDIFEDNIIAGNYAGNSIKNGKKNIILGTYAGQLSEGVEGSVYLGSYAGRLETSNNKLYIHNTDYATITEFRENSLIYGDFSIGTLWINNHLKVREEIQLGAYQGVSPSGGMLHFVDDGGGGVKPQYHDGTDWQDFANGLNYYLDGITKATADVGTTSDAFKLTFSVFGTDDQIIQLGANAFNSTPIRSANGTNGKVQLSNGAGDFTSGTLSYNTTLDKLSVGNILNISTIPDINAYNLIKTNNDIIIYNNHVYSNLNGTLVRLDNEPTDGESNEGENLGTSVDLYAGMSVDRDLTFYGLKSGTRVTVNAADVNNDIIIDCDYTVTATSPVASGIELIKEIINTDPDATNIVLRRLVSGDSSVTFDVSDTNVIDIRSTGVGGGEANTGLNVGGGIEIYARKTESAVSLEFRTLVGDDYIQIAEELDDTISFILTDVLTDLATTASAGESIISTIAEVGGGDATLVAKLRKLNGISDIEIGIGEDDELEIGFDSTIPIQSITFTGNSWNDGTKKLSFLANVNNNIRDIDSSVIDITLGSIIIGNLLTYNAGTNTLNAVNQGLAGGDPLVDIQPELLVYTNGIIDQAASSRNLNFILDSGAEVVFEDLGFLAYQDKYIDASDTVKGIVQVGDRLTVNTGTINVPVATTEIFGVIKVGENLSIGIDGKLNATLGGDIDAVLYDTVQYYLHDDDAGNLVPELDEYAYEVRLERRLQARSNIGAAYVNGSREEAFNAANIKVNISEDGLTSGTYIYDNKITSDWGTIELVKDESKITVGTGHSTVVVDTRVGGLGIITFQLIDSNGTTVTVAQLNPRVDTERGLVADWLVSGNFEFAYDF